MLLGGQRTEFHMNVILPIASYSTGCGFPIQFAYRPKATPFASETIDNRPTEKGLETPQIYAVNDVTTRNKSALRFTEWLPYDTPVIPQSSELVKQRSGLIRRIRPKHIHST